jgi:hypothetical protein
MTGAIDSVLVPFSGSHQSLSRSLSPVDHINVERSPATSRCPLFSRRKPPLHPPQPVSSLDAVGTVSCKNTFNTQRLVPAPFNEFYPKRSGTTIPLHPHRPPARALPIESSSLSALSEMPFLEFVVATLHQLGGHNDGI